MAVQRLFRPQTQWRFPKMSQPLMSLARRVASLLEVNDCKIVFAESCTAGLVSAVLGRIPGISRFHCGSAVVYQLDTKTSWLGISPLTLSDPGAVSEPVAVLMATEVLARTPAAGIAVSITGHLGPHAPSDQDGLIFIAIAHRTREGVRSAAYRYVLPESGLIQDLTEIESVREWRQWKATEMVFDHVIGFFKGLHSLEFCCGESSRPASTGGSGDGAGAGGPS